MTTRPASPDLPPGIAAGVVTIDVATAAAGAAHPEWIKVAPRGRVECRDGRSFAFDPERLVARFQADAIDIPVDLDHGISRKAMWGERADAVAWLKELQARPDGIYARPEWLAAGKAALDGRTHRFVSPTFHHDEGGHATWLHSAALVAAPALAMPALAAAGAPSEISMLNKIAQALGLAAAADEAACLSAIATLMTRPADGVAKAVHQEALGTITTLRAELDGIKGETRKAKVTALVDDAIAKKKIVPAQRESYVALCASDTGLAEVEKLLAAQGVVLPGSGLDTRLQPGSGDRPQDPVALAAAARAHSDKEYAAGRTISMADAMAHVTAQQTR